MKLVLFNAKIRELGFKGKKMQPLKNFSEKMNV
jgi:hypothetical protein